MRYWEGDKGKHIEILSLFYLFFCWYPLINYPVLHQDVDVLLVRDLDSHISMREVSAVKEFLNSTKDFHIMRDHPFHIQPIMGGLWGIRLTMNRTKNEAVFRWSTCCPRFFNWSCDLSQAAKKNTLVTWWKWLLFSPRTILSEFCHTVILPD